MLTCRIWHITVPLVAAATFLLSCGSSSDSGGCAPGQSIKCAGMSGCAGAQVCNGDGSGYGQCTCADPGYNVGNVGGNAGTTSIATGGQSAAGSSPASNLDCVPATTRTPAYPPYIPARHMPGSCTDQAIIDYYENCYQYGECSSFMTGGAYETCGACLTPSDLTASSLGPFLTMGHGTLLAIETNVAGCEEILGETACAPKMQIEFLCEYGACAENCPVTDYNSFNGLLQCMATALGSQCVSEHAAAQCLKSASNAGACTGSNFQEQFAAVAKVFCS